ncbi:HNH endonuclease [Solwaraspora sp. WMMD937]|uniref:HNH endonuclease n=1 Tax=Solwaraspora sp. WMMD937 TaxID=3016090 RepID=UPI00249BB476|nr:HNH endonuclease [Solwaraspora sp. WMMD937]WFE19520.1 HNH endonuclease [Solwaraspora sp. WMMD937]
MDKRLRWFNEGAPMLRLVLDRLSHGDKLPVGEDYYACPCCLTAYSREAIAAGVLTVEHVPPQGLGGRGLLLTCSKCNNSSGTHFDSHAIRRADAEDFMRGKVTGRTLPATFRIDGIPLRGTAQWTEEGIQIFGVPKRNDRRVQDAHFAALDAYAESGNTSPNASFTVHARFDEARARLSWIRAAYLAAFAAIGYVYIWREVMYPVREQLKNPDARILPTYMFRRPEAAPDERRILLVDEPDELRCVAVSMGEHTVFLPGLWRTQTWDQLGEAFGRHRTEGDRLSLNLNGKEMPWPRWPTYFLDR